MLYAQLPEGVTESAIITTIDAEEQPDGFLPLVYNDPPSEFPGYGYQWSPFYREADGERIEQFYVKEESINPPRSLSKRNLMNALKSRNLWTAVKGYMQSTDDLWEQWEASTTLDEDEDLVKDAVTALKASLSLTDEQIEAIMAESEAE